MKRLTPSRRPASLRAPGMVVVAAALGLMLSQVRDLAAQEPWPWGVPRGHFFVPPGLPDPIPSPLPAPAPIPLPIPPGLSELGVAGPTDRCLIIVPSTLDPRAIKTADAAIDPGIFVRPRVQGLPVRGRTPRERHRR